jgi:hypothetical protein
MNTNSIESRIVVAHALRDTQTISDIYMELTSAKLKMDRWFDKFLDRFSSDLDSVDRTDPIKKLYNSKFDEYSNVSRAIRIAENYMKAK